MKQTETEKSLPKKILSPSDIHKAFEELHDLYLNGYVLVHEQIISDRIVFYMRHIRNGHRLTVYCEPGKYTIKRYGKIKKTVIW